MNESSNQSTNQHVSNPSAPRDVSFFVIGAIFVLMATSDLIGHQWVEGTGWVLLSTGLFILVRLAPMTEENWKESRYLACLILFVIGVSLLVCSPGHSPKKRGASPASLPPASAEISH